MEKNKNVPVLRFPEFSGEWEKKKLGELCESIVSGKTKPEIDGEFPVYGSTGIIGKSSNYTHDGKYLLVARVGANAGRINIAKGKYSVTDNTLILNVNKNENVDFIYYYILVNDLNKLVFGSGQPLITGGQLKVLNVIKPQQKEQQQIALFLYLIDDKLRTLKKKKTLLEQYKKGMMQKIFSQELRFKDDNGAVFPKWEQKKLGKVSEINPKNGKLPDIFIYIDLESVVSGVLLKEDLMESINAPSRAQRILRKGDILFQMVRPYQKNNLYFEKAGDYVASTGYAQIRTSNCSKYIFQYLHFQKFVDRVIERCTGTSYPAINSTDLSNISIAFPCLEEQTKIANFLSAIDDKINLCNMQIEKTEQWKKGLLQKMFV